MNNTEKLYLAKLAMANQIPSAGGSFDVNGTSYSLANGPGAGNTGEVDWNQVKSDFGQTPQQQVASGILPGKPVPTSQPGGFNNLGADGKPMAFEPDDGALATSPEIMEMGRTGTYPQKSPAPAMAATPAPAIGQPGSGSSQLPLPPKPTTGTAAVNP